jgi:hypothetical protein
MSEKAEQFNRLKSISDALAKDNKATIAKLKITEKEIEISREKIIKLEETAKLKDKDLIQNENLIVRLNTEIQDLKSLNLSLNARVKKSEALADQISISNKDSNCDIKFELKERKYKDEIARLCLMVDKLESERLRTSQTNDISSRKSRPSLSPTLDKKTKEQESKISGLTADFALASKLLKLKEEELENSRQLVNKQDAEIKELSQRLKAASAENNRIRHDQQKLLADEDLRTSLDKYKKKLEDMDAELRAVKNERKIFYDTLELTRNENEEMIGDLKAAEEEIVELKEKINLLQSKTNDLENEKSALKNQLLSKINESHVTKADSHGDQSSMKYSIPKSELDKVKRESEVLSRKPPSVLSVSDHMSYKDARFLEKSRFHVIEVLNEKSRELETIFGTSFNDLADNFQSTQSKISKKLQFFKEISKNSKLGFSEKHNVMCNSIKNLLTQDDGLIRLSKRLNEGVSETGHVEFLLEVVDEFISFYSHIKQRVVFVTSILLKALEELHCKPLITKQANKSSGLKLNLKEMYLTDIFFDEENQAYLKNCIVHYSQMKFAQRKIENFMKSKLATKKKNQNAEIEDMNFGKYKASIGKSLLQELLTKTDGYFKKINQQLSLNSISHK